MRQRLLARVGLLRKRRLGVRICGAVVGAVRGEAGYCQSMCVCDCYAVVGMRSCCSAWY